MSLTPSTPQTTRPSSEGYTNGVHTGPSYVSGVNGVQHHSMDRGASEYSQPGLHSPHSAFAESQSEKATVDHSSAAQYNTPAQDARPPNYSSTSTPNPEYAINPSSARSGTFPEYIRGPFPPEGAARFHPSNSNSGSSGGMAQTTSPSLPLADGRENSHHDASQMKSDPDVPIDPNIAAATSPTYPPAGPQYSPYPPQAHDMAAYQGHQGGGMYAGRPEWGPHGYGPPQHPHGLPGPYGAHPSPTTTVSSASSVATAGQRPGQVSVDHFGRSRLSYEHLQNHPLSQVYSFVPIPGAQQHKRPRRRYEEIERMYKCGWNGCEKAYGTLNHLNAHVTMQSHGTKRTPEGKSFFFLPKISKRACLELYSAFS